MVKSNRDKILYETTSTLRSVFLAIFQVVIPNIIVVFIYLLITKHNKDNYGWIILLAGFFFVIVWSAATLLFSVYKGYCYIDQIIFIIPLILTISFVLFATNYQLKWYEFLVGIVFIVVAGYFIAKMIVKFLTLKSQIILNEEHKNYLDENEIHKQEKEYLQEFIDMYKSTKHTKKNKINSRKKDKKN